MVGLLLCGLASASHNASPSPNWKALREKNLGLGFSPERVDQTLGVCRKNGLTVSEADALLCPVYSAHDESLPTECVLIKIEEGLAKRVEAGRVAGAAEARLECLRKARQLIDGQHPRRGEGPPRLLVHTCMALESGLPEEVLKEVFSHSGGRRPGRLVHVLEAGETLQLAGLDAQDTKHIMNDFIDRDLNRMEILRAVDYVLAERRKGRDFKDIHADLWVRSD